MSILSSSESSIRRSNTENIEQPILHIKIGELSKIYNSLKPTIEKHGDYYLSYIRSDPDLEKKYNVILNKIIDIDEKIKNDDNLSGGDDKTKTNINKSISETLSKPAVKIVAGIGLGALMYVLAIMIYNYLWKSTIVRKINREKKRSKRKIGTELNKIILKKTPIIPK
jgi:hypothetical protein